jgi:hypothetical protein
MGSEPTPRPAMAHNELHADRFRFLKVLVSRGENPDGATMQ